MVKRKRAVFFIGTILLMCCTEPPPDEQAADLSVSLDDAVTACQTIKERRARGRCTVMALKVRGAISMEDCSSTPGQGLQAQGFGLEGHLLIDRGLGLGTEWHDECLFQAAAQSKGPTAARYEMCRAAGGFARTCGFQLWQSELNQLSYEGDGAKETALAKAEAVLADHAPHARWLDQNFKDTFWTWFWGNWWSQQDNTSEQKTQPLCENWTQGADREACLKWAPVARAWVADREMNRPQ